jgi:hypothetical protein
MVGFEPTVETSPTTVFETVPFNRSGTSPVSFAPQLYQNPLSRKGQNRSVIKRSLISLQSVDSSSFARILAYNKVMDNGFPAFISDIPFLTRMQVDLGKEYDSFLVLIRY